MSINLKKIMITGAALLMFASAGAGVGNTVNVSAKHVRTHRVYRHSKRALRAYRHKLNVHKYNWHKLAHRRSVHKYNLKKINHRRNARKIKARKNRRSNHSRLAIQANSSINPSLINAIHAAQKKSAAVDFPANYYGNYFDGSLNHKQPFDAFIHLAKHGSYALSNPDYTDETQIVHQSYSESSGDQGYWYTGFENSMCPSIFHLESHNIMHGGGQDARVYGSILRRVPSEAQGIKDFQNLNIFEPAKSTKEDADY